MKLLPFLNKQTALGALIVGLITLFAFLNSVPWASKGEVATLKSDIQRELGQLREDQQELRQDVREILRLLRR